MKHTKIENTHESQIGRHLFNIIFNVSNKDLSYSLGRL